VCLLQGTPTGNQWLLEQQRLATLKSDVAHWAHAFLALARKLRRSGLQLDARVPRWRFARPTGAPYEPLTEVPRAWLIQQATLLLRIARAPDDPLQPFVARFLDWAIWFRIADACYPGTHIVRRDAIKHDFRHHWWTEAAKREADALGHDRRMVASVVQHEHVVPKRLLIRLLMDGTVTAHRVFEQLAVAALVTTGEHAQLNRRFRTCMPDAWDPKAEDADPWARYKALGIGLRGPRCL
jgi:hypothetical protein